MDTDVAMRPEWTALMQTRRWVFVFGIGLTFAVTLVIGIIGWSQMSAIEHVLLPVSVLVFLGAAYRAGRGSHLWLFAPALALLLLCAILVPHSHPQWIPAVLLTSYLAYTWVVLSPRWIGLFAVVLGPLLLAAVWVQRPTNVIAGGLILADGFLAVIQVVAATVMLWWAWNSLVRDAERADEELLVIDARTAESMQVTERATLWRLAGTRLHESVLNSIRYVLATPTVDRQRLRSFAEVTLAVPEDISSVEHSDAAPPTPSATHPFDKGRLLVTSALAGNAFGGISFLVYLLLDQGTQAIPAVVLGTAGSVICMLVVIRRKRVRSAWALPMVAVPAILPWLFVQQPLDCREALILSPILNIAGFCVMVIAAWATRTAGVIGLMTWGLGGVLIAARMPADCRQFMTVALLNSLVVIPLIVAVTYAGSAAYERSRLRVREIRQQEVRERSRAAAALDINAELHDVVSEAVGLLRAICAGADVDARMREELRRVDGRLRADMQVDPRGAGAFALLAKGMVDSLSERGVVVTVKGISCSADQRPLPDSIVEMLDALTRGHRDLVEVQVITNGREDYLTIGVPASALFGTPMVPGTTASWDGCVVDADVEDGSDLRPPWATVVVSRAVETESDGWMS